MCGINGIISTSPFSNTLVHEMNNQIIHRGPDDNGVYINSSSTVSIGMRRLSIIDIETGNQPMYSSDNSIIIVFNGEIYNYNELKKVIENTSNYIFNTKSDTEVILKGYELYGCKIFDLLNGMFSIAIYDTNKRKIFLCRDRVGEKPLYYWFDNEKFVFCSELKSLKKYFKKNNKKFPKISNESINIYFSLTFIPAPFTIYSDIFKLEPGTIMEIDENDLSHKKYKYWDLSDSLNSDSIEDYNKAKITLKNLLYDSVEKRMISDVPYGVFLSGGVDSSIITAIMSDIKKDEKIKTFSIISKNNKYDESKRSNAVSKYCNTEHYPILMDFDIIKNEINNVILSFDEPFADSSALPSFFVSKITSNYVKVALTGDGGDEVFGGYNRYLFPYYSKVYKKVVPNLIHNNFFKPIVSKFVDKSDNRGNLFKIKKFINAVNDNELTNIQRIITLGFQENDLNSLLNDIPYSNSLNTHINNLNSICGDNSYLTKSRYIDHLISLEGDMLVKVDRTSMLNSLECRSPFLDHNLIEFSFKLPDNFLIDGTNTKRILKDTFKNLLPKNLFDLPKSGFGIPIGDWLRNSLKSDLQYYASTDFIKNQGIFNENFIKPMVENHINSKEDNTFKVWTFYCFQKWWINNHILDEA
jgi:asparagine synthase (glutamine-hydrolysing)